MNINRKEMLGLAEIKLIDSSTIRMAREMNKIARMLPDFSYIENIARQFQSIGQGLRDNLTLLGQQQALFFQEYKDALSVISDMTRNIDLSGIQHVMKGYSSLSFRIADEIRRTYDQDMFRQIGKALEHIRDLTRSNLLVANLMESYTDINEDVSDYFTIEENPGQTVQSYIVQLVERFKEKNPLAQKVIAVFLIPLLINIASSLALQQESSVTHITNVTVNQDNRVFIKNIRQEYKPQTEFELAAYSQLHIVRTGELMVRSAPKVKSKRLGTLTLGKKVKIIEKTRKWSFIEYYDEFTETYKEGWVFTRYLAKIIQ